MEFEYPWRFASRRSAVMATNGMVATSHPLAARAGLRVLEDGGTAADAAVATAAVLNFVEPHMTGVGGDAFALTQFDGEYAALNATGPAPAAADIEEYRRRTDAEEEGDPAVPKTGGMPVTVPGALSGWRTLVDRYGTRELGELLGPAIEYAREGVPVSEFVADVWSRAEERLQPFERSVETFLPPPGPGDRFANPAFADSLETIAAEGVGALYGGEIGEAVVEVVREHGGTLALSDLEGYEAEWVEPISTEYRGVEMLVHPPNSQGAVTLEALNVAEQFDLPGEPTNPDRLHHLIEAVKLGFADGREYITDPAVEGIPLDRMLSKAYAEERAAEVGHRAGEYGARAAVEGDTAYLAVVDGDGNAVSFINSIFNPFGSGLTAAGFLLQNRGHGFSLDPGHANALAPGKRPYHTNVPAMLREDGDFRAAWGVVGGAMQPQGHLQVVSNLVDAGLNPQAAIDAPRFRWLDGRRVTVETDRVPREVVANLRGRGHRVVPPEEAGTMAFFGGAQMVYRTGDGTLIGGSDPRGDGQAIGF